MSTTNTNTNTNATTTTMNHTTTNEEGITMSANLNAYGFTMPTHTKKSTSRPDCFTKAMWDTQTYNAYMGFVHVIERRETPENYLLIHASLFNVCGMPADIDHLISLTAAMVKDTTSEGEKVRKVSAISSFRQFFNGAWVERENRKVVYTTPKAPKPAAPKKPSTSKSKNGPTKAQLAEQNAELLKQLEALKAALGIAA